MKFKNKKRWVSWLVPLIHILLQPPIFFVSVKTLVSLSPEGKAEKRRREGKRLVPGEKRRQIHGERGCKHGGGGATTCGIHVQVSVELLGNHGGFNGGAGFCGGSSRRVPHHARFRLQLPQTPSYPPRPSTPTVMFQPTFPLFCYIIIREFERKKKTTLASLSRFGVIPTNFSRWLFRFKCDWCLNECSNWQFGFYSVEKIWLWTVVLSNHGDCTRSWFWESGT